MTMPANSTHGLLPGVPVGVLKIHRGELIAVAIIGIILGVIALVWPGATLLTVAVIFGIYLIASGIFRITAAFVADGLTTSLRWLTGIMGLLVIVAGVICLANPFSSLVVLAFVIGIGWIAEGVIDVMSAVRGAITPRWFGFVSGIVSILAGIATFVLPAFAIVTFVIFGGVLLIVVSVTTLLTLPRKRRDAGVAA
ncbi:MAG: hypothetical protein JWN09_2214 [Microbacteriaceae bacterium]|jgi:uncharacterized membrane protein HdeD (DUF308 family)|nr:hypothetical protein [Microbacteriaceae bacterium]